MSEKGNGKHWIVVINNPEGECLDFNPATDQYMVCGLERGEQGTQHIQGYVQFTKRRRFKYLKERWPRAHIELARGSPEQNRSYCTKEGASHEHGEMLKGQGARNDLNEIRSLIDSGATCEEIRDGHYSTYMRYQRAIISDIESCRPGRTTPTELHILWGDTGTGKSLWCAENLPRAYWKSRGEWWDGYDGHEDVVIDEFYGWLPFDLLLRLADRYPLQVPVKGGFRKFVAKRIFITSNKPYTEWYHHGNDTLWAAFRRRLSSVREFKKLVNESP